MNRRDFGRGLATSAMAASVLKSAGAFAAAKPSAVTGPITGGKHGYPFSAFFGDIAALGYVEEEYFLDGAGAKYDLVGKAAPDGKWTLSPAGTAPFRTRMLVRRPHDPAKFNGVVVVEWLNVTAGFDTVVFGPASDGLYRDGFVYVGVSCQKVGVDGFVKDSQGLKVWDPERYRTLSIPGDSISYDILSQAGRAVGPNRPRGDVDPLAGLEVKKVVATGGSQSAGRLRSYINAVQPRDKVFDGFIPIIDFGLGFGFDDTILDPSAGSMPDPVKTFLRTRIRDDLDVPVFIVNSETETLLFHPSRQPDSDRFRFWEVAGASHVPAPWDRQQAKMRTRDGLKHELVADGSEVSWGPSADAALSHLAAWFAEGKPPPASQLIEHTEGVKADVVRDDYGNARGGVRLPELEVPVARYHTAIKTLSGTEGLRGTTTPFAPGMLQRLYPNRDTFVSAITRSAQGAEAGGFIEPARLDQYIAELTTTRIGA